MDGRKENCFLSSQRERAREVDGSACSVYSAVHHLIHGKLSIQSLLKRYLMGFVEINYRLPHDLQIYCFHQMSTVLK